jgi:hypothetical protein
VRQEAERQIRLRKVFGIGIDDADAAQETQWRESLHGWDSVGVLLGATLFCELLMSPTQSQAEC